MRRILKRHPIPHHIWQSVTRRIAVLRGLDAVQMARLRELATWFLHSKSINGAHDLEVTRHARGGGGPGMPADPESVTDCFDDWVEVILYPGAFRVKHEEMDDIGLVHNETSDLTGESWLRGPVVLSWDDIERDIYIPSPATMSCCTNSPTNWMASMARRTVCRHCVAA